MNGRHELSAVLLVRSTSGPGHTVAKGRKACLVTWFFSSTLQDRKQWRDIESILRQKYLDLIILYPAQLASANEVKEKISLRYAKALKI